MEERTLKILWSKSGSGSISPRALIPINWLREMGIDENNRELKAIYDKEKEEIVIKKK